MTHGHNILAVQFLGLLMAGCISLAALPAQAQEALEAANDVDTQMEIPATEGESVPVITFDAEGNAVSNSPDIFILDGDVPATDGQIGADTAEEHGQAEENKGGFPQLDVSTYASQVFWLVVSFLALYVLMARFALPRVTEVLDMRQTQKNGNLDRAAQLQEEADKIQAAVDGILSTAQDNAQAALSKAEETVSDRMSRDSVSFAEQARKRIVTVEENIAKAKAEALTSLADIAAEVAADIVSKVADVQVNKADAKKLVQANMSSKG